MDKQRELELHVMEQIMKTECNRSFLFNILRFCGTYDSVFHKDQTQHIYNSAKRDVGLWFENELKEANVDLFYRMMKENENG